MLFTFTILEQPFTGNSFITYYYMLCVRQSQYYASKGFSLISNCNNAHFFCLHFPQTFYVESNFSSFLQKKKNPNVLNIGILSLEATPRFELGIKVLQTSALPLGYVAILARVAGFEPAHDGIRIHCLTAWRYPIIINFLIGVDSGIRTHA